MTMTILKSERSRAQPVANDPRWRQVVARDRSADGQFWYSVATTGIYCRPSCPSRAANPKNIQLHDTLEDAKATGFRPCKRCNPDGLSVDAENAALVAKACRLIENSEEEPALGDLASAVDRSPSHFHRVFKATTGLTPKDYADAHRATRIREGLMTSNSVTEVIYDAGFNSSGRFYEKSTDVLGMTPTQYRSGGINEEIRFAVGECSLGALLVASSKKGICAILLGGDPDELVRDLQDRFPKANLIGADREYEALVARCRRLRRGPGQVSTFRSTFAARPSSSASGAPCRTSRRDAPFRMPNSHAGSARPRRCARWRALARRTRSRWRFLATGSCATTACSPAMRWGVERKRALIAKEAQP